MYCPKCGTGLFDETRGCISCGFRFGSRSMLEVVIEPKRYCTCRNQIPKWSNFCMYCGRKIKKGIFGDWEFTWR